MHGLGNDFVIVDARQAPKLDLSSCAASLGDRRHAIGFDQLVIIYESNDSDARLVFFNQDGSPSATCGNATRCVAQLLMSESGQNQVFLKTGHGILTCENVGGGLTRVNMGIPEFNWKQIPLVEDMDTLRMPLEGEPCALSLGNPHCVFFEMNEESTAIEEIGPQIECHHYFPERTNVEFVSVQSKSLIRMRIWERGTGITMASGSGACASAIAACRRGFTGKEVSVETDGGTLFIDWRDNGVWKTGPTSLVFTGQLSPEWND